MRKIVLLLALVLGGCTAIKDAGTAVSVATTSVTNPVTKDRLAQIEIAANIPLTGLVVYRRACIKGVADSHCRANIAVIQAYTRQLPPYITQLRGFVNNNDQINAVVIYDQITALLTKVKSTASDLGVNLGVS
jgi:hypothetical protein